MKVLLADDHDLFREGLKLVFKTYDPSIEVVEADAFDEATAIADQQGAFDLILLDLKMRGMNGIEGVRRMCDHVGAVPVVVLSGAFIRRDIFAALDNGAAGFIPKTLNASAMFNAINLVLSGEKFIPSAAYFRDGEADRDEEDEAAGNEALALFETLTPRERQVLGLLIDGNSNNEIAALLDLREVSVRTHLKHVFRKLGVKSRTQAVGMALRKGFRA